MVKLYTRVARSIWRSRKFRSLTDELDQLVYLHILTAPSCNSVGCYILPPELAAVEMKRDAAKVKASVKRVEKAGLIRVDWDEFLVGITGFMENAQPTNRRHLTGIVNILEGLPRCDVMLDTAADVCVAAAAQALDWGVKVEASGAFLDTAHGLVKRWSLEARIKASLADDEKTRARIADALLIDLS